MQNQVQMLIRRLKQLSREHQDNLWYSFNAASEALLVWVWDNVNLIYPVLAVMLKAGDGRCGRYRILTNNREYT